MTSRIDPRVALLAVVLSIGLVGIGAAEAANRKPAPATAGRTVTGGKASLAALRGKPVFINVWSSW